MSYKELILGIKTERSTVIQTNKIDYKDRKTLNVVVTNLLCCVEHNDLLLYSRNKERSDKWKNNPYGISNYKIMKAIDWLEQNGYVFNTIASRFQLYDDTRQMSYIMATEKFVNDFYTKELARKANDSSLETMPVISLRDDDGREVIYRNTKDVQQLEALMRLMNKSNAKFVVTDEEGNQVNTAYKRVYKENWQLNGRMYSSGVMSVENRESKGRLKFTIDRKDVVEIDYNCIHIRILADLHNQSITAKDVYYAILPDDMHSPENRNVMKGAVNRILNCKNARAAVGSVEKWMEEVDGHTFNSAGEVTKYVYKFLGKLKKELFKDRLGLRLANIESNIMSDVVQVFVALGRPVLPVHDSAIVLKEDKDLLARTMADCYRKHLNVSRMIDLKCNEIKDGQAAKPEELFC